MTAHKKNPVEVFLQDWKNVICRVLFKCKCGYTKANDVFLKKLIFDSDFNSKRLRL